MVARGAGDVGCAHCTMIGAVQPCQVCTRLVCETCAADWTTCDEPIGREVRLGRTARLRDIDPSGRIGLVTRLVGPMKLFDVRRLRWIAGELPRQHAVVENQIVERLTATGELVTPEFVPQDDNPSLMMYEGLLFSSLVTDEQVRVRTGLPLYASPVGSAGHYVFVSDDQLVGIVDPERTLHRYEPLPRKMIQGMSYSANSKALASGTWGEITIHHVVGEALELRGRIQMPGTLSWLALEEPWLAACVAGIVYVWHVGANLAIGREAYTHEAFDFRGGCFSRDGKYLALGNGKKLILHDLDNDVVTELDDHTDDICLVRFVGSDHLLVTADEDNRVVMRPRTPTGYVRATIEIDIPSDAIAIDLDDALVPR